MFKKSQIPFWLIVVLPTALSCLYFGVMASDRYTSVSSFVIRSPQKNTGASGLTAFLQNVGFSRSTDDSFIVNDFVLSRDALKSLETDLAIRQKYESPNIDLFSRFDGFGLDKSNENFYEYYQEHVKITLESSSSITTLKVKAYTSEDAHAINEHLLKLAENLVNRLNSRGRSDMVTTAEANVQKAEERVAEITDKLAQYRNKHQIFDIEKQSTLKMQLISKLQDQLIAVQTQLTQLRAVTPENPQIAILAERENAITAEIRKETDKVLGSSSSSINEKTAGYEKLILEKEFAAKQLASALATLEQSKQEAEKKQLYLERISQPSVPDAATEPKRIKSIFSVFLLSLVALGVFKMLYAGIREHQE